MLVAARKPPAQQKAVPMTDIQFPAPSPPVPAPKQRLAGKIIVGTVIVAVAAIIGFSPRTPAEPADAIAVAPAATPRAATPVAASSEHDLVLAAVDQTWATSGYKVCNSMDDVIATGISRSTAISYALSTFADGYTGEYKSEVVDLVLVKLTEC